MKKPTRTYTRRTPIALPKDSEVQHPSPLPTDNFRAEALGFALMGPYANNTPEQVVQRAAIFEDYLLHGAPKSTYEPSLNERIATSLTHAFVPTDA
jgi:hypothetical protein